MDRGQLFNALTFPLRKAANLLDMPAVVLLYHRIKQLATDPLQLAVSPEYFVQHIKYLKSRYNLISVEEFSFLKKNNKKFSEKTVLITFDDGYEDNYHNAIPILEAHSTQALFFITTSNIGVEHENWWDDLERILLTENNFPQELNLNSSIHFKTSTDEERQQVYWHLQSLLKFKKTTERDKFMQQLYEWKKISAIGRPTHRMMANDELKKLATSKSAVIGAHTHSHASLACQTYEEQLEEIKKSKDFLEQLLGEKITQLAYPFGTRKDFNADTLNVCGKLGIEIAFANYYGQVHLWTNHYQVPRMLVRDWDGDTFKNKIKSFFRY